MFFKELHRTCLFNICDVFFTFFFMSSDETRAFEDLPTCILFCYDSNIGAIWRFALVNLTLVLGILPADDGNSD